MKKKEEAAVKDFVKVNQECLKLRNRREDVCIRQELSNYFNEDEELQKLLDKANERFKETEFSKDEKRQTDENRYQFE